jgi:putative RecB family exonuclease
LKAVLAPTRISQYQRCPLQYRLAAIDKIVPPIPPSLEAVRGSMVHAILEALFVQPNVERTFELANSDAFYQSAYAKVRQKEGSTAFDQAVSSVSAAELRGQISRLLGIYFQLEEPEKVWGQSQQEVMLKVDFPEASDLSLFGFADRIDFGRAGEVRIVDYKTGKKPAPQYAAEYIQQMNYYALAYRLLKGITPYWLDLLFLNEQSNGILRQAPTADDLAQISAIIVAVWTAIKRDCANLWFTPRVNPLCAWCGFQSLCSAQGGVTPELTPAQVQKSLHIRLAQS